MPKFDNRFGDETKTEWLTPPYILEALGKFDLDPCAPVNPPWHIAETQYTIEDNGFIKKWFGRVWMNPPYNKDVWKWMKKLSEHGNGIALIFARTETKAFYPFVWFQAHSIFFFDERLHFYHVTGERGKHCSGAPSVLVSYGEENTESIRKAEIDRKIKGKLVELKKPKIEILVQKAIDARNHHSMVSSEFIDAWKNIQEFYEDNHKFLLT